MWLVMPPTTEGVRALSDVAFHFYVCLSVPSLWGRNGAFQVSGYYGTLIGNPMLEVEPMGQRGPVTMGSGQNGLDLENL